MAEPGDLLDLLFAAGAAVRRVSPGVGSTDLGRTQMMVLRRLWVPPAPRQWPPSQERGPARISDIAGRLGLTPAAATQIVDQLEARGFVERRRSDRDRRVVIVHITAAGERLLLTARQQRRTAAEAFLARLTDGERADLEQILRRLLGGEPDRGRERE